MLWCRVSGEYGNILYKDYTAVTLFSTENQYMLELLKRVYRKSKLEA